MSKKKPLPGNSGSISSTEHCGKKGSFLKRNFVVCSEKSRRPLPAPFRNYPIEWPHNHLPKEGAAGGNRTLLRIQRMG